MIVVRKAQMNFTADKAERAKQAWLHTERMNKIHQVRIDEIARNKTRIYVGDYWDYSPTDGSEAICIVEKSDSVKAIFEHSGTELCAVLNFASYKNPGGGFLGGSLAQEESLCHASFLYNVLSHDVLSGFYECNKEVMNDYLYTNRAAYSPNVMFASDDEKVKLIDVITCAAPNWTAASKYASKTREENTEALKERIDFVISIAEDRKVNTLIAGAFGCGVFGQDATEVAQIFKGRLAHTTIKKVIFPIPDEKNLNKFKEVFAQA